MLSSRHKVQAHTGHSLFLSSHHEVLRGLMRRLCREMWFWGYQWVTHPAFHMVSGCAVPQAYFSLEKCLAKVAEFKKQQQQQQQQRSKLNAILTSKCVLCMWI